MMSHLSVQSINVEELPAQEYSFVKTQQAIYNLCTEIENNSELKSQIEEIQDISSFLTIAAENGYEFTASDLQTALSLALENTYGISDEFDDYELDEEELEAVAGGARAAAKNSYWHETGIDVDGQCFYLLQQSLEQRQVVVQALRDMDKWEWLGNNSVKVTDTHGKLGSFVISNITNNGAFTKDISTLDYSFWEKIL
ncbi:Nif11-like leader peptide family natural product precursor [Phormidium sp. LEGE 05292]|uniref:Nif11-like leader peptide family natural product precursor n=1 Tax=[Phormidium] sp. LEGE 05292 TaxID=767427 RepID=UPI00187E41FA|nr:Nif11-like leader peptide family natural product precursor [Phormidium sp. LEGE 05292]MBE9224927.1 Nif11-like leader peptide family natural product precursor [Phormidium sp. LEGE 05292]